MLEPHSEATNGPMEVPCAERGVKVVASAPQSDKWQEKIGQTIVCFDDHAALWSWSLHAGHQRGFSEGLTITLLLQGDVFTKSQRKCTTKFLLFCGLCANQSSKKIRELKKNLSGESQWHSQWHSQWETNDYFWCICCLVCSFQVACWELNCEPFHTFKMCRMHVACGWTLLQKLRWLTISVALSRWQMTDSNENNKTSSCFAMLFTHLLQSSQTTSIVSNKGRGVMQSFCETIWKRILLCLLTIWTKVVHFVHAETFAFLVHPCLHVCPQQLSKLTVDVQRPAILLCSSAVHWQVQKDDCDADETNNSQHNLFVAFNISNWHLSNATMAIWQMN